MKKIIFSILAVLMFVLTGCNNKNVETDDYSKLANKMASIKSYSLTANMTIYKNSKEIKANIKADYLKPNYYKVTFTSNNGNEQIIVKNDDGIFVLTPSLDKEFKFESDWPLNSAHSYLVNELWDDIKDDSNMTYSIANNQIIISAKLDADDQRHSKIKFYYDLNLNKPLKAEVYNNNDELVVLVEFTNFTFNPTLTKDSFNKDLIMDNSSNVGEGNANDTASSLSITVGYVFDDTILQSKRVTDDCIIMCYGGAKNYTIVAKKLEVFNDEVEVIATDYEILDNGLVLYSKNVSRYYVNDIEIAVYSNVLTLEEVTTILSDITAV